MAAESRASFHNDPSLVVSTDPHLENLLYQAVLLEAPSSKVPECGYRSLLACEQNIAPSSQRRLRRFLPLDYVTASGYAGLCLAQIYWYCRVLCFSLALLSLMSLRNCY